MAAAADVDLSGMTTTNVQIDTDLLARLRERHPGKDDRSLIEDMARIELGFGAVRDAQKRNALSEDEAIELGVQAVHEAPQSLGVRRFVIDTSVLLSAVIAKPDSHPSLLLDAVRAGDIEMVACGHLLDEVQRGLDGRYFRERIARTSASQFQRCCEPWH